VGEVEVNGSARELTPEERERQRAALAQLRRYPDPVLRMRAAEVESFDDDLRRLGERMTRLMRDAIGVGLAANQVGILRRIFILATDDEEAVAAVNPAVTPIGEEREADDEGCLSLPSVVVPVERAVAVELRAQDLSGKEFRLALEGLGARGAQHELDHLDGILMLDRTTQEARRQAIATLRPQPILTLQ
jgi:peptide deformylase